MRIVAQAEVQPHFNDKVNIRHPATIGEYPSRKPGLHGPAPRPMLGSWNSQLLPQIVNRASVNRGHAPRESWTRNRGNRGHAPRSLTSMHSKFFYSNDLRRQPVIHSFMRPSFQLVHVQGSHR